MSCRCGDSNCICCKRCLCSSEFCLCIICFDLKKVAAIKSEEIDLSYEFGQNTPKSSLKSEITNTGNDSNTVEKRTEVVDSSYGKSRSRVVFIGSVNIKRESENYSKLSIPEITLSDSECELIEKKDALNGGECSFKVEDDSINKEDDSIKVEGDSINMEDDSIKVEGDSINMEDDSIKVEGDSIKIDDDSFVIEGNTLNLEGNTVNVENNYFNLDSSYANLQRSNYRRNNESCFSNCNKKYKTKWFRRIWYNRRYNPNKWYTTYNKGRCNKGYEEMAQYNKGLRRSTNNLQSWKRTIFMKQRVNIIAPGNGETENNAVENSNLDINFNQETFSVREYDIERNENMKKLYQSNTRRYYSGQEVNIYGSFSQNEACSLDKKRKTTRNSSKSDQNKIFSEGASISNFVVEPSSSYGRQIENEMQNANDGAANSSAFCGNRGKNIPDLSVYDFDENENGRNSSDQTQSDWNSRKRSRKKNNLDNPEINVHPAVNKRKHSVKFSEIYSVYNIEGGESGYEIINDSGIKRRRRKRKRKAIKRTDETNEEDPDYELVAERRPRRKRKWRRRNTPCKKEDIIDRKIKKEKIPIKTEIKIEKIFIKTEDSFIKKEIKKEIL